MMRWFEKAFPDNYGPESSIMTDVPPIVRESNFKTHLIPEHLEEADIVDIKFVEKAFGAGCDLMAVAANYMRRKQKRFNVKAEEIFHVEGESEAKEKCNDDA